jgi:cell division septum initiation protein DivIVA
MTTAEQTPFSAARRGYDRTQVEAQLDMLSTRLRTANSARESAVAQVRALSRKLEAGIGDLQSERVVSKQHRAEADVLHGQVAALSTIPNTVDGMSERLQQMARIAQDEVNDMRTRATSSAAHVLMLAQTEADELRERSENERHEFDTERRTAQDTLRRQLEESRKRLEQLRNEADSQLARLAADLADRGAATDQRLAVDMQERRSAMLTKLAHLDAAQREDADRILESAAQQARAQLADAGTESQRVRAEARHEVAAAQRELDELCSLQHQVAAQLTAVRALLDWTLPQMPGASRARPENNDGADRQGTP